MLRPTDQRARMAKNFLILNICLLAIYIFVSSVHIYRLTGYNDNMLYEEDYLDGVVGGAAILYLFSLVLSAVFFIMWFRRSYYNLEQTNEPLKNNNAMCAYSWFIPIYNLFKPVAIMQEMFFKTDSFIKSHEKDHQTNNYNYPKVSWWWAIYIIGIILNNISNVLQKRVQFYDEIVTSGLFDIAGSTLHIVAGIILIYVIKDYTAKAEKLNKYYYQSSQTGEINPDDYLTQTT